MRAALASVRAEAGDAQRVQPVHAAQRQRVVGGDHGEVHGMRLHIVHDAVDVRGLDAHTFRVLGDARVAGDGHHLGDLRVLLQLADDGVLPPAAADDQYLHMLCLAFMGG